MLGLILLLLLVVLIFGTIPYWPYSRNWGYRPSGILSLLLILLILLTLIGYIPMIGLGESRTGFTTSNAIDKKNASSSAIIVPEKTSTKILTPETNAMENEKS